jgi:hypothetical protein
MRSGPYEVKRRQWRESRDGQDAALLPARGFTPRLARCMAGGVALA